MHKADIRRESFYLRGEDGIASSLLLFSIRSVLLGGRGCPFLPSKLRYRATAPARGGGGDMIFTVSDSLPSTPLFGACEAACSATTADLQNPNNQFPATVAFFCGAV
jgi:hypothetical protein